MTRQPTTAENVVFAAVVLFCLTFAALVGYSVDQITSNLADRVAVAVQTHNSK
jgi:hypothetical protein